jgi:hypothetical protein
MSSATDSQNRAERHNLQGLCRFSFMLVVAHRTSKEMPLLRLNPLFINGFNSVSNQSLQSERTIEKRDYSAVDKASYRQRQGILMADLLEESAEMMHNPRSLAVADCIRETASAENVYFSSDQTNFQTGECFDGYGVLTEAASSRLCPSYQARMSKRARKMVFAALHRVKANSDERLRFVTLTVPNLGASFERTMKVLDAAIVLLKKRQWFKRNFRGGIQSLETTIGEASHYHSHVHILAFSKWIVWERLGEEWTSCVREACRRFDVLLNVCTSHLRLVVDVRLVVGKSRGNRQTIGFEDAVHEVCKYVVKGSDWLKVPVEKLCEIERVLRGRKMVRTFGECSDSRSDTAEIRDFSGADTHIYTTDTIDGGKVGSAQKLKRETLIDEGVRLITSGRRDEWLLLLRKKMRDRRAWRRKQLLLMYPQAIFWTLDGKSFRNYENFDDAAENVVAISDFRRRISVFDDKITFHN